MKRYEITFERNGRSHVVTTTNVERALYSTYGLLAGATGHLNKLVSVIRVK